MCLLIESSMSQSDISNPAPLIARFSTNEATRFDNVGRGFGARGNLTGTSDFKALLAEPNEFQKSGLGEFGTDRATRADRSLAQDNQFTATQFGSSQFTTDKTNISDRTGPASKPDPVTNDNRRIAADTRSENEEQVRNDTTNAADQARGDRGSSSVKPTETASPDAAEANDPAAADSDPNVPAQQVSTTDPAAAAPNITASLDLQGLIGEAANLSLSASLDASNAGLAGAVSGNGAGTAKNEDASATDALTSPPGAPNGNVSLAALALAAGEKGAPPNAEKSAGPKGQKDDPKSASIDNHARDGAPAPGPVDSKTNPAIEPLLRTNVAAAPNAPGNSQSSGANPASGGSNPGVTGLEGIQAQGRDAGAGDTLTNAQNVAPRLNPDSLPGLAARIARKSDGGNSVFDLRLDPAELGQIQVRIEIDADKQARAHIVAERPEALAELAKNVRVLENALRQSGVNLNPEGVSFSLASDDQSRGFSSNGFGQNNSQRDNAQTRGGLNGGQRHHSRLDLPDQALVQALGRVHSSRLNLLA